MDVGKILTDIIVNEREDINEYYGIVDCCYNDDIVYKYIDLVSNIYDKIYIAQWCNNHNVVNKIFDSLVINNDLYNKLKSNNKELNLTIDLRILQDKYSFLNNLIDQVVVDMDLQDLILSLDDKKLNIFKLIYNRLCTITSVPNILIEKVLYRLGRVKLIRSWKNGYHYYDDLINDLDSNLDINLIDKLIYLFTSNIIYDVKCYDDLVNLDVFINNDYLNELSLVNGSVNKLKKIIIGYLYGINIKYARNLVSMYKVNSGDISELEYILNEDNYDKLYNRYVNIIGKDRIDYLRVIRLEDSLKRLVLDDINSSLYKIDNKEYSYIDGVKVYDSGYDFKLLVTALGAQQSDFKEQDNYFNYWNSDLIRSHGNCVSLIGNYNLTTASVKNVILGFNNMNYNLFLLCGTHDLNSTPDSRKFSYFSYNQTYMLADDIIKNTYSDYNELVFERRSLSGNLKYYKKNPDYIVYIDDGDSDKLRESIKAAKDFNIPIVRIDREKIAFNEYNYINSLLDNYNLTGDINYFKALINRFICNQVGSNEYIRNKYFSDDNLYKIISSVNVNDDVLSVLRDEIIKIDNTKRYRKFSYISNINSLINNMGKVKTF